MSDIFHEVDEEVRRERLQEAVGRATASTSSRRRCWSSLAVGGWRGYQWWEAKKAADASAQFDVAVELSEQGKHAEAEAPSPSSPRHGARPATASLARFREAAELAETSRPTPLRPMTRLPPIPRSVQPLQDLATVRAGLLLVDTAPLRRTARSGSSR